LIKFPKILLVTVLVYLVGGCNNFAIKQSDKTVSPTNWTHFGGSTSRSGAHQIGVQAPLENIWRYKGTSAIGSTLLAIDGVLYLTTMDGRLDAVNIETGKKLKRKKFSELIETTCSYYDDDLFVAYRYGKETLGRLDLEKGKFIWKKSAGDIASEPLVKDDAVFVAALYKHIDKFHAATGKKIWSFDTKGQLHASPALAGNTLVAGCDKGFIYGINAESGTKLWSVKTGAAVFATPVISNETVFVSSTDSLIYAISLEDGDIQWKYKARAPVYQTAGTNGKVVIVGASNGELYCLDAGSGKLRWLFRAGSVISTMPVICPKIVYIGSLDKNYYAVDLSNGNLLWSYKTKGRIRTSPIVWGDYLIGASEDNLVYAFKAKDKISSLPE